eukprot:870325-Pelagomonas_calceolata.AAC.1
MARDPEGTSGHKHVALLRRKRKGLELDRDTLLITQSWTIAGVCKVVLDNENLLIPVYRAIELKGESSRNSQKLSPR